MEYTNLGKTGLRVSKLCLGCMSFGSSKWAAWVVEKEKGMELVKRAWDLGINFFDTADVYSNGESEKVLGEALRVHKIPRERVVIATKCFFMVASEDEKGVSGLDYDAQDPRFLNRRGLSRKHIFDAVDASLARLGVEYIDLYQIHRWDYETPIEETMEALHDVVKSGKVRYIGASSMFAWQFAKANHIAEKNGWTKFVSMQNLYNLLYREEEREMLPLCADEGVGVIPWSPLARGKLAAKETSTVRKETDRYRSLLFSDESTMEDEIVARVKALAEKRGVKPVQVAIAWLQSKPVVSSPIIGVSNTKSLEELVESCKLKLTTEEIQSLEELYRARAVAGHQ